MYSCVLTPSRTACSADAVVMPRAYPGGGAGLPGPVGVRTRVNSIIGGGGVKLHLLDLGFLEYDEGWPLAAAGVSTISDPAPASPRREVAVIAALIEHPKAGPIL